MEYARFGRWVGGALGACALAAACSTTPGPEQTGPAGVVETRVWTNGGFETGGAGTAPAAPWTVQTFLNPSITVQTPQTFAGLNLAAGGVAHTVILSSATGPGTQTDPDLGATASLRWPRYGNQCAIVNQHGNNKNVNILAQTMTVAAGDVNPADGQIHVFFTVAPVLQNPAHTAAEQPYYFVLLTDVTKGTTLYSDFNLSGAGIPWKTINGGTANEIDYTDWQLVDISGAGGTIAQGDKVELQIIGSGCEPGAHWGEIYVDGVGSVVPGLNVIGTAPAQSNANATLAYTLTYTDGGANAETGVVLTFTTPPGTTFQSINAPGLTCTTPAVGSAGTITCTLATIAAGGTGTLTITVNVPAGTTGTVTESAYQIQSTQETALIGPPINTLIGCTTDSNCLTGNWCDESLASCTPTLANGVAMPTDPAHTNPTLDGLCSATGAAALVCVSKVCDTTDNKCGYLNGDGTCTAATGPVVCRSGVCDPDGKCGYANGDGPCTAADGGTVCRSTACSTDGLCEVKGGCNVNLDCTGGDWCDETTHACTAPVANGGAVPTDGAHTNPTLNGKCTAAAGALTCVSKVCDTKDNDCGYANGDGPCTAADGATVCRSGACSTSGVCEPAGGCDVDADCTGGKWCDETTHVCTPEVVNGGAVPTDGAHTNPTLNGTCTAAAGALTCVSKVCDTKDNECGYANGDGPCTVATGTVVCRSGACSTNGTCEPAGGCDVDADCTGGKWCDETTHVCTAPVANGGGVPTDGAHTNPTLNGTCTAAAGTLTCVSKVCDTKDNDCGYANGDGPCTAANGSVVCRSGACSTNGLCEAEGGCNVDSDCTSGNWCNETMHKCTVDIANGNAVPTDGAHTNPTLNGTCTAAAGALTCVSKVCDTKDNDCGYANGDGPCTATTGPIVCRSGSCSASGVCEPAGGCNVDSDCATGNWCDETTHTCTADLANGVAVPTDTAHTNPTLNGTCTAAAGALVCVSGVCDTKDNECGYANGDGPCTSSTGSTVCRSGTCGTSGTCQAASPCTVDSDCSAGNWCDESMQVCTPQLANGTAMPTDAPHTNPTLNGTCTAPAAALVCQSGVCDTDNECGYKNDDGPCTGAPTECRSGVCDPDGNCGYKNGDGPCTGANGTTVCRSTICATMGANAGLCEQCLMDTSCATPTPACDTTADDCVQCTTTNGSACTGATPICDATSETCAPCNGDNGDTTATDTCPTATPYCNLSGTNMGACGKCATNTDCTGHPLGPVCDPTSGACGMGCTVDTDCNTATQWCNAPPGGTGSCVPKLANGIPLPTVPTDVATCTTAVGARVCISGVCDPKDNECGYQNGDGPCDGIASDCRSGVCDKDGNCGFTNGDGPCTTPGECRSNMCNMAMVCVACSTDNDCPSGDYCSGGTNASCLPKQGNGQTCTTPDMCISDLCATGACGPATAGDASAANDEQVVAEGGGGCGVAGGRSARWPDGALSMGLLVLGAMLRGRRKSTASPGK